MKPHEKLRKRVPLGDTGGLGDEAFAGLAALRGSAAEGTDAPSPPRAPAAGGFRVVKSRKGNWPIAVERRGGGKSVTILRNVEGDAVALLAALRKYCGAGGAVREGAVEIQGDQREKVTQFLETEAQS